MPSLRPKVVVVTPTYNSVETIGRCVASVACQDYPELEHLVIDGASRDGTLDVVRSAKIACFSEPDAGIYDAFNKGVLRAQGDILTILGSDDVYAHPSAISRLVQVLEERQLDVVHARIRQVDAAGCLVRTIGRDVPTKALLLRKMWIAHPSMLVRRSVYERFGGFSTAFHIAADYEFCLRIWDKVRIGFVDEVVVDMRVGGASNSNPSASYRESMSASVLHGANPLIATARLYYELLKHAVIYRPGGRI